MICTLLYSNSLADTLKYIQNINENIDAVRRIVDVSNSTIANEISVVNTVLVSFTVIFGVLGIGIGAYISWLQKKVSKMSSNIEKKEKDIIDLVKTVEDTEKKIQSDISGLYKQLREEETITLLKRLEEEPQDISNLEKLLWARTISDSGYNILKSAYMKLLEIEKEQKDDDIGKYKNGYLLLFFQHFMSQSIQDYDICDDLRGEFDNGCQCAFKRDIIKSTKDLCQALSKPNVTFERGKVLVDYLKAINRSKYKELSELKDIFQNEINNATLLVDAIERCTSDGIYLKLFGIENPNIPDI